MKKTITTMVLAGLLGLTQAQNNSICVNHVQSATAVSRVLGDGRKVEAVILKYDTPIKNKSLSARSYMVEGMNEEKASTITQELLTILLQ